MLLDKQCLKRGLLSPLLFYGPENVGQRKAAHHLAAKLLHIPCDQVAHHPDFHLIQPEEGSFFITIDQVRSLLSMSEQSAYREGVQIFCLDPAHAMMPAAASALLKRLEEPTGSTLFILMTSRKTALLSTIRSRCTVIPFFSVQQEPRGSASSWEDLLLTWLRAPLGWVEEWAAVEAIAQQIQEEKAWLFLFQTLLMWARDQEIQRLGDPNLRPFLFFPNEPPTMRPLRVSLEQAEKAIQSLQEQAELNMKLSSCLHEWATSLIKWSF
jgi:hypothetical protein